ncbi:hypothetical protein A3F27_00990 [Candidatus Kaiserbacteria bacterium RIFCSPHIGHO2_12_FULL_53_13]|uniref:Uncharacterized protein n=1 Tax=Candidatus Kaiserbacteria bacterium RIFCSPHIGHO2_12_FULL_53_13 TaxID=1798502 RepID=A0A1F6E758_9BACT|nr:MAG: hypothetical protein A3F27_00990 [Candidatus Kaiserbacteria bacterium RIFCSPHIGHO2_12_FULL_53_13]OGG74780.1 MAG: hypothetical protein A3A37_00050 [Candidatus Kaiserbacteria bacterium RIFCSPLOWO2_01_FULL_52_36]
MLALQEKRQAGRYYTEGNPFLLKPFRDWIEKRSLIGKEVLEPFAGRNNLIRALREIGAAPSSQSFDIVPHDPEVEFRDTLKDFPEGFEFCVTNPPWLAKNSAKRRGLSFPETRFDDLYKHALDLCLTHCNYVAALIPATFLRSDSFRDDLEVVIFLHDQRLFADTDNPVCLALFSRGSHRIEIFNDAEFIGHLDELERYLPQERRKTGIVFNHPDGNLGFIAFDDTKAPTIRFIPGEDLSEYEVGFSSRMITRIKADLVDLDSVIRDLNNDIRKFREATSDVFLTPFKGLRKDGQYRRRMDYGLARDFIAKHVNSNT